MNFKHLARMIGLISTILGIVIWVKYTTAYSAIGSDFTQDYLAATALRIGQPIYGPTIERLANTLLGFEGHENYHPPTTALLFLPISYLPYPLAVAAWNTLNLVLYVLSIYIIFRTLQISSPVIRDLSPLLLIWFPFISNIGLAQISLLVIFLTLIAWQQSLKGSDFGAGVALGAATLVKLFPGYLFLFFLLTGRLRALAAMVVTVAIGFLSARLVVGSDDFWLYFSKQIPEDAHHFGTFLLNGSLPSAISSVFSTNAWTQPITPLTFHHEAGVACGALLTMVTAWIIFRRKAADENTFSLLSITMLIVSPITWIHVMPIMLLPIGLLLRDYSRGGGAKLRVAILVLALFSIPDVPVAQYLYDRFYPHPVPWSVALASKFTLIGLVLLWLEFYRLVKAADKRLWRCT